ncbi:type II CAAX prenyl endopeptidase Rce1 family protein [Methanobrevibacter sp.]|uniref:CPBP family glutamic-type intramembrane protease n=1 Tax=Methanobrevibacter sp. TaxID=66852 RepID=UPI00388FF7C5
MENGTDFPFYNDIPKLSSAEWVILAIVVILFAAVAYTHAIPQPYSYVFYFGIMLGPALYICKGNYGLFFKKLGLIDLKTIILCTVGYLIYATLMAMVFYFMGYHAAADSALPSTFSVVFIIATFVQLIGEEFFKVFLLLIAMYLVYKFTNNRNLAVWLGIIFTLFIFGVSHMGSYGRLLQILLIQGLGSIFDLYAYMKTKNVLVSYIVHLLIDFYAYFGQLAMHA